MQLITPEINLVGWIVIGLVIVASIYFVVRKKRIKNRNRNS
jgi:hypothetical protein